MFAKSLAPAKICSATSKPRQLGTHNRFMATAGDAQRCKYLSWRWQRQSSPNTYGSSTIGGKKPTVCSIAMPFCSRYTQASSLVSNPTSRFGSSNRGRRVKISFRAPRPNFAAQPALLVIWVSHCFSAIANTFFFYSTAIANLMQDESD